MTQIRILSESLVERDDLKVGGLGERRQVGVAPTLRRELRQLSELSPKGFQHRWLEGNLDARVGDKGIVKLPCLHLSYRDLGKRPGIICQS